jgi:hypothetical protein
MVLLLTLILSFVCSKNTFSQDAEERLLLFGSDDTYIFEVFSGEMFPFRDGLALPNNGSNSLVSGDYLVYINPDGALSDGLWLLNLRTYEDSHIAIETTQNYEFADLSNVLNGRFAFLTAGIFIQGDHEPRPMHQVTNLWLIDVEQKQVLAWYWRCNQLVHVLSTDEFGLYCPEKAESDYFSNFEAEDDDVLITERNLMFSPDLSDFVVLYTRPDSYWYWFNISHRHIMILDNRGVEGEIVNIFDLGTSESREIATYNPFEDLQSVLRIQPSPNDRYLAILFTSNQVEIRETVSGELLWTSENDIGSAFPISFDWSENEQSFFVLHTTSSYGRVISEIRIEDAQVMLARNWEVPSTILQMSILEESE